MLQKREEVEVGSAEVEAPIIVVSIGGFEVCREVGCLIGVPKSARSPVTIQLGLTICGSVYHAPHRKFANNSGMNICAYSL